MRLKGSLIPPSPPDHLTVRANRLCTRQQQINAARVRILTSGPLNLDACFHELIFESKSDSNRAEQERQQALHSLRSQSVRLRGGRQSSAPYILRGMEKAKEKSGGPTYESLDYDHITSAYWIRQQYAVLSSGRKIYGYSGATFGRWAITFTIGISIGTVAFLSEHKSHMTTCQSCFGSADSLSNRLSQKTELWLCHRCFFRCCHCCHCFSSLRCLALQWGWESIKFWRENSSLSRKTTTFISPQRRKPFLHVLLPTMQAWCSSQQCPSFSSPRRRHLLASPRS
eukprot:SAG31_NODE_2408_length_5758_cov_10.495847_6_plen_284_part_00